MLKVELETIFIDDEVWDTYARIDPVTSWRGLWMWEITGHRVSDPDTPYAFWNQEGGQGWAWTLRGAMSKAYRSAWKSNAFETNRWGDGRVRTEEDLARIRFPSLKRFPSLRQP